MLSKELSWLVPLLGVIKRQTWVNAVTRPKWEFGSYSQSGGAPGLSRWCVPLVREHHLCAGAMMWCVRSFSLSDDATALSSCYLGLKTAMETHHSEPGLRVVSNWNWFHGPISVHLLQMSICRTTKWKRYLDQKMDLVLSAKQYTLM